jgi:hypothetical protein
VVCGRGARELKSGVGTVVARFIYQKPSGPFVEVEDQKMANREPLGNRYLAWLVASKFKIPMYHSSQTTIHGAVEMSQTPRGGGSRCNIGRQKQTAHHLTKR